MGTLLNKLIREPFIHFILISIFLYLFNFILNPNSNKSKQIILNSYEVEKIKSDWNRNWKRAPNDNELNILIEDKINEKILYKEALSMELEKNDALIYKRLVQKVKFLFSQNSNDTNISDETLKKYFKKYKNDYCENSSFTFSHVFLNFKKDSEQKAKLLLHILEENRVNPIKANSFGDKSKFREIKNAKISELSKKFGIGFSTQLTTMRQGRWEGPLISKYGFHLVYITNRTCENDPIFEDVKFRVKSDFKEYAKKEAYQRALMRAKENYQIIRE